MTQAIATTDAEVIPHTFYFLILFDTHNGSHQPREVERLLDGPVMHIADDLSAPGSLVRALSPFQSIPQ